MTERAQLRALGACVRYLREGRGLDQRQTGALVGKGQVWVSRIECGRLNPKLADLRKLAGALGSDVASVWMAAEDLAGALGKPQ